MGARNVEPVNGGGDWIVVKPEHWIFDGTGMKKGDRIPGLIGWEYHGDPPEHPRPRGRRGGHRLGRAASDPAEVDRHDLPRAQGQLRLQRLDHLLGPGPVVAAGAHPALVALVASPRARRARAEDHPQPAPAGDSSRAITRPARRLSQIRREVCLLG